MRALLCSLLVVACAPKTGDKATDLDSELPPESYAQMAPSDDAAPAPSPAPVRPAAPPGKGLRTGVIERAHLIAVLDAGPGAFLRQLEVTPRLDGNRFVGWQLVQLLDATGPLHDVDLVPGDVLLAVNGKTLSRPDQLQAVWDSLRTANELRAQLWRGDAQLELAFAIEPGLTSLAAPRK